MPAPRHARLTVHGTLPGSEIFNFGISLSPTDLTDQSWIDAIALEANSTVYDDFMADTRNFWYSLPISNRAKLMGIKVAFIGPDGLYEKPPVERFVVEPAGYGGQVAETVAPNQQALAVTLHSGADLGRVKGRFYLPMVIPGTLESDGTIQESVRDTIETAAAAWINDINNQPGIDVLNIRVVVASAGRHNKDGSVKLAPGNHDVTQVSVGRVVDTQRRRRNKQREYRGTPTGVS